MKISEFNTKNFLGNTGAVERSYILINYEDINTSAPVTYKASLQEVGKAISANLNLLKENYNEFPTTMKASQGAYVDQSARITNLITVDQSSSEVWSWMDDKIERIAGDVVEDITHERPMIVASGTEIGYFDNNDFVDIPLFNPSTGYEIGNLTLYPLGHDNAGTLYDLAGNKVFETGEKPIVCYDAVNGNIGYYNSDENQDMIPINPMNVSASITLESAMGDSMTAYLALASDGAVITAQDCGAAVEILRVGANGHKYPVIVYDSSEQQLGYYEPGNSQMSQLDLSLVSYEIDPYDNTKINLLTLGGSVLTQIDTHSNS